MIQIFIQELIGAVGQLLIFTAIPFLVWLIWGREKEKFFKYLGLVKGKSESDVKIVLITVTACACYIGAFVLALNVLKDDVTAAGSTFAGQGMKALLAAVVYAFIRTGLSEEIIFRGFIGKRIASKWGFAVGNTVQAILFGLLHGVPFGLANGRILVAIIMTVLPGAMGWYMGWLDEKKYNGSIIPGWITHGVMNFLTIVINL